MANKQRPPVSGPAPERPTDDPSDLESEGTDEASIDEGGPDDDDDDDDADAEGSGSRSNRVLRFARRMMDRRELAEDTKDLLYTVVTTSDKAKTEAVKMVAREVRSYLSELKLKEDLMHLATSYSLEISLSLKPLLPKEDAEAAGAESESPTD